MKTGLGVLAIGTFLFGLWIAGERLLFPQVPPAEIRFKDIFGNTTALSDLRGKPALVLFWASTCSVCIREIPDLIRLHEEFAPEGFRLFAVAMAYDPPNRVVEIARNWRLPYSVVLDLTAELAHGFGSIEQIPTSFLIAPDGSIAMHQLGRIDLDQVRVRVRAMLDKDSL